MIFPLRKMWLLKHTDWQHDWFWWRLFAVRLSRFLHKIQRTHGGVFQLVASWKHSDSSDVGRYVVSGVWRTVRHFECCSVEAELNLMYKSDPWHCKCPTFSYAACRSGIWTYMFCSDPLHHSCASSSSCTFILCFGGQLLVFSWCAAWALFVHINSTLVFISVNVKHTIRTVPTDHWK